MVTIDICDDVLRDDPVSADIDVAKLRFQLRNHSLPQLEAAGLVEWDRTAKIVRKGPDFEENHPPLHEE